MSAGMERARSSVLSAHSEMDAGVSTIFHLLSADDLDLLLFIQPHYLVRQTILHQPKSFPMNDDSFLLTGLSVVFFLLGQIFVLSSFYKLGLTGTFLGDYCGILMDAPVRTFPFNVLNNPMYVGSSLSFLGLALYYRSPIGLLLTLEIYLVYRIAVLFEQPYTEWIYQEKNK